MKRNWEMPTPTKANPLNQENLHEVLIPRIGALRAYVDRQLPAGVRPMLAVDDILQDVWIAAYRTAPGFQQLGPDAIDRWLLTIARSKLVDAVRYARRVKRGGDHRYVREMWSRRTSFTRLFTRLASPVRTPSNDAHLVETGHVLLMALSRLGARQREAVELQFIRGLSRREIAARLGTTEKAVKELVHRGLRLIREMLGPATKYFTDANPERDVPSDEAAHVEA
jgi:RNA polymerase sigma-70 factor (ECF subfamily)